MFGTQFLLLLTSVTLSPCWPLGLRHSRLLIGSPFADTAMTSACLADACHVRRLPRVCDRSANHTFNEWRPLCRRGNVEPTFKNMAGCRLLALWRVSKPKKYRWRTGTFACGHFRLCKRQESYNSVASTSRFQSEVCTWPCFRLHREVLFVFKTVISWAAVMILFFLNRNFLYPSPFLYVPDPSVNFINESFSLPEIHLDKIEVLCLRQRYINIQVAEICSAFSRLINAVKTRQIELPESSQKTMISFN